MSSTLGVSLVAVLVAATPGLLLGFAVPRGRARWVTWASAPALTLGLLTVAMAWLPKLGLPNGPLAVLVAELALAGVAVTLGQLVDRRGRRSGAAADQADEAGSGAARTHRADGRTRRLLPHPTELVALGVPALLSLVIGHYVVGQWRYPPGWDAMNHIVLTRSILDSGSTAMTSACTTGSTHGVTACSFYPIAVDISWAQELGLIGGRLSAIMIAWAAVVGPLMMVAALYAAVRVFGGRPLVAGAAAALAGGPRSTLAAAAGQPGHRRDPRADGDRGPAVVLALRDRYPVRLGLLAGIGLAGLLMTHTYDVLFAFTLALGLVVTYHRWVSLRSAVVGAVVTGVAAAASMAPVTKALLAANGERTALVPLFHNQLGDAFHYWVTDPRRYALYSFPPPGGSDAALRLTAVRVALWLTIPCLVLSLLCFALRDLRWARAWVANGLLWTAVGIWTSTSTDSAAATLAHLWYGNPSRLRDMVFPVYTMSCVAGAAAVGSVAQLVLQRVRSRDRSPSRAARASLGSLTAAAVVAALVVLGLVPSSSRPLRTDLGKRTPTSSAYPRVFAWVAQRTQKGQVVAFNRNFDWMPWIYADYGTKVLFGIPPFAHSAARDYSNRWRVWMWLTDQPGSVPAGCLVRTYGVEYVLTSSQHIPGRFVGAYRHDHVGSSPNVDLVHSDQGLNVYRVNDTGRACPA